MPGIADRPVCARSLHMTNLAKGYCAIEPRRDGMPFTVGRDASRMNDGDHEEPLRRNQRSTRCDHRPSPSSACAVGVCVATRPSSSIRTRYQCNAE
jgi:hypothetical protein